MNECQTLLSKMNVEWIAYFYILPRNVERKSYGFYYI